jgi:hypothetical protein
MKSPRSSPPAPRRDRQDLLAVALIGALAFTTPTVYAQDHAEAAKSTSELAKGDAAPNDAAELAKKLQNPLAALISAPIQNNFDFGAGANDDGFQYLVRIQPVIPVSLSEDWNLISRTILPVIYQEKIYGNTSQSGLGDTIQNLFFSPKEGFHGWIWGAGPVFQFPTATDDLLGSEKWCMGPTAVILKQEHGWTYGMLLNQFTSFAGEEDRQRVNYLFLQPFLSYTLKSHTTFSVNSESIYNWENQEWTVPINASIKQLLHFGKQPVQFELGYRYYAQRPLNGPDWGLRFTATFLFPK